MLQLLLISKTVGPHEITVVAHVHLCFFSLSISLLLCLSLSLHVCLSHSLFMSLSLFMSVSFSSCLSLSLHSLSLSLSVSLLYLYLFSFLSLSLSLLFAFHSFFLCSLSQHSLSSLYAKVCLVLKTQSGRSLIRSLNGELLASRMKNLYRCSVVCGCRRGCGCCCVCAVVLCCVVSCRVVSCRVVSCRDVCCDVCCCVGLWLPFQEIRSYSYKKNVVHVQVSNVS